MASGRVIRVGLVGYGMAGETFHAPLIAATEGLEMVAIVTSDAERRLRARARYPVTVYDRSGDLMSAGRGLGLDLVVVAAPNRAHLPVAHAALAAGFAVVVDKPLATTAAAGRQLAAAAQERGLLLSAFHNRRWDGDFLTVRRLVTEGVLGQVRRFESRYERWRPEVAADRWRERADPEEGGGVLLDLGSHLVDQALVAFGPPRSVYAEIDCRRPHAAVDDDTFVAVEHLSGVRSHLWASSIAARTGPRFRVLGDRAGYEVFGMDVQEAAMRGGEPPTGAAWGQAPPEQWGTVAAGDEGAPQPVPTETGDYRAFYQGIVAALTEGAPPPVLPSEAILGLEVLDAARESAKTGQIVHLTTES